jgi:hypothetical protein
MIEVLGSHPSGPAISKLVQELAEEALAMGDLHELKVFWYYDDTLDRTAKDVLYETEEFDVWFENYFSDNEKYWDDSYIVVYSDTVPGRDELRFHVVLGSDMPVYALCVNKKTRQAQWYLQETPTANKLAEKRK